MLHRLTTHGGEKWFLARPGWVDRKWIVLGANLNEHVEEGNIGYEEVMGRYGAGTRNTKGSMVVDFAKRMHLMIINTYFKKKDEHRVTYKGGGKTTQVVCNVQKEGLEGNVQL